MRVWILAWGGCAGDGEAPTGPSTPDTSAATDHSAATHTGTAGPTGESGTESTPSVTAQCALQADNTLRVDCRVRVDPPGPVTVRYAPADGGGTERVRTLNASRAQHDLTLWFLAPDTDYTIEVRGDEAAPVAEVEVTTGALPPYADVRLAHVGRSTAELIGTVSPCPGGAAVVFDPRSGDVLWYQRLAYNGGGFLDAVSFTEDDTILGLGGGAVTEVDWAGRVVRVLEPVVDLPLQVHHDVFRRAGLTYVLFQELVSTPDPVSTDGFYVFDAAGLSWEWHLLDFATPRPAGPGPFDGDWSHANAIWADGDGDVYASFRHLSGVVKVEGDPSDPAFGQILWRLTGEPSDLGTDFDLTSVVSGPANFERQHNVFVLPDGHLTLLDNREGMERSRVLEIALDEAAGTAVIDRSFEIPGDLAVSGHCDFQGGAWRTAAGNPLATCAPVRTGTEFDAATGEVVWTGQIECVGGSMYVPRFVPLTDD